eukprot:gene38634-46773_t
MGSAALTRAAIRSAFDTAYTASFSRLLPAPVRLVNLRVAAVGKRPPFDFSLLAPGDDASLEQARHGTRRVRFHGRQEETSIGGRPALPGGGEVQGPAILEQKDATIVIEPGFRARIDTFGNVIITRALLLVDLQNDFLHPNGAYGRAGQTSEPAAALPARLAPLAKAIRERGGMVVATLFTLPPGRGGEPLISPHLMQLRPFLKKGDFVPGSWGQAFVDELAPHVDSAVEKI